MRFYIIFSTAIIAECINQEVFFENLGYLVGLMLSGLVWDVVDTIIKYNNK